jgi:hypothetical protein
LSNKVSYACFFSHPNHIPEYFSVTNVYINFGSS